ncbi:MAG: hypothetical protein ACRCW2_01920 [Cellulosilyticaceae bacterium]
MEIKIKKWSKVLKWLIAFSILWYVLGLSNSLPEVFSKEEWSTAYAQEAIREELGGYINFEESTIVLSETASADYLLGKQRFTSKRLAEIICDLILFGFGFFITRRLSKKVIFDNMICNVVRWSGILICISSFVVPSLGHVDTGIALIKGFGFDVFLDFYRLACGVLFILIAYVLRHGQFLQEEYDTTL